MCTCVCVWGWEGYFGALMVAQCSVQLPVSPLPQVPIWVTTAPTPREAKLAEGTPLPPPILPAPRVSASAGVAQPTGDDTAGMGSSPCAKWERCDLRAPEELPLSLARLRAFSNARL